MSVYCFKKVGSICNQKPQTEGWGLPRPVPGPPGAARALRGWAGAPWKHKTDVQSMVQKWCLRWDIFHNIPYITLTICPIFHLEEYHDCFWFWRDLLHELIDISISREMTAVQLHLPRSPPLHPKAGDVRWPTACHVFIGKWHHLLCDVDLFFHLYRGKAAVGKCRQAKLWFQV